MRANFSGLAALRANAFGFIEIGIMAAVSVILYLWNHCDEFREFCANIFEKYFDVERAEMRSTEMYIEGFKPKLGKDTLFISNATTMKMMYNRDRKLKFDGAL